MNFLLITRDNIEHRFVTQILKQRIPPEQLSIMLETHDAPKPLKKQFERNIKRYGVLRFGERVITKGVRKLINEHGRFFDGGHKVLGNPPSVYDDLNVIKVRSANSATARKIIQSIKPDYLLIYGTGIIKDATLALANKQAFNMHTGISPNYRGSDCIFWPLYFNDFEHAGATVHECTADVDGGGIFRTRPIHLTPQDDQYTAFAKSVKTGAELYDELVTELLAEHPISLTPQQFDQGHEFTFVDRTFVHDLWMLMLTKSGTLGRQISERGLL